MQNKKEILEKFLNPSSIAIVGATDAIGKVGSVVTKNILKQGYDGKIYLVNPNRKELEGNVCYASLGEINDIVDVAVIAIPADLAIQVINDAPEEIKNFIVISAGFAESGEVGQNRQKILAEIAQRKGLTILGPNCLGLINPFRRLNATFYGEMPKRGNIALISQSGALLVSLMDILEDSNLGFSTIFSIGNKLNIDESDLIEYLGDDEKTKVIGIYLEGVKHGDKFREVVSKVARKKPIVFLKAGKTEEAKKAAMSHTGSMAGSDDIFEAVLDKYGAMNAKNLEEFLSLLKIASLARRPRNNQVIVLTNAGGIGVLAVDAFDKKKLNLARLKDETRQMLEKILPSESSLGNPIDLLGDADDERYQKTLEIIEWENVGSIIVVLTPQQLTPVEKISRIITQFNQKTQITVVVCFAGGKKLRKSIDEMEKASVPNFTFIEQAVNALDSYYFWSTNTNRLHLDGLNPNKERIEKVKSFFQTKLDKGQKALSYQEAVKILDLYDLPSLKFWTAEAAVDVKFPVAVKIDSSTILHKTEKKGVILGVKDKSDLKRAIIQLKSNFPNEKIIIQPMLSGGLELIVGLKKDETFGPVILYGLGGIYTEALKIKSVLVPPLSLSEIEKSLEDGPLGFIFKSTRKEDPYDKKMLAQIIQKISFLAQENKQIKELDINPLVIYNDGRKPLAVDIKIIYE